VAYFFGPPVAAHGDSVRSQKGC